MWWKLLQGGTAFAVLGINFHWQWTPTNYLGSILAYIAALLVTVGLTGVIHLVRAAGAKRRARRSAYAPAPTRLSRAA